jgi:DNA transposition AAA+ family ATPase
MITQELKSKIVEGIRNRLPNYASAAKMAVVLGTSSAQLSRILKGETEGVLSEAVWITIARKLDIQIGAGDEWKTAITPAFTFITTQLSICQTQHASMVLCDAAGVGKTHAARQYAASNRHVAYVDCSQVKTKTKLVAAIAQQFGVGHTGHYADVYADLVFYLRSLPDALIILDEVGDLDYKAFLEVKAMYNATEWICGWYMMGADGLKAKIDMNLKYKRVGYAEIFDRFGDRYQKASPDGSEASQDFRRAQHAVVCRLNCPEADEARMFAKTGGSLRRLRIEIQKFKSQQQS